MAALCSVRAALTAPPQFSPPLYSVSLSSLPGVPRPPVLSHPLRILLPVTEFEASFLAKARASDVLQLEILSSRT